MESRGGADCARMDEASPAWAMSSEATSGRRVSRMRRSGGIVRTGAAAPNDGPKRARTHGLWDDASRSDHIVMSTLAGAQRPKHPEAGTAGRWLMADGSELYLRSELHDAIRRDAEELGRAARVLRHQHVLLLAPP